ncbi:MAG: PilZ domain-containing protein [Nitrospirota bacterium]
MKTLLISQDLKPLMATAMNFLHRSDIAVHTAATNDELLKFHIEKSANLIVASPALPGLACETLFHIIRRGETMKKVSLLLVCENDPAHKQQAERCNANAVLTRPVDPSIFSSKVQQLLDVPPRRSYRVVLNIAVEGVHNSRPVMCTSENVSAHGMLIRTRENLAAGDRVECSFYLPDGFRVGAIGDIARACKADQASETTHYGIRFRRFASGAESALAEFVDHEILRQYLTDPHASTLVA